MENVQSIKAQKGLFGGLFANYAEARVENFRRRIYTKTVRELEQLSDQRLQDIGIPRSEIHRRAYQSVYHHEPIRQNVH
ncbi:DUF1127 domain-containing protein [Ruegeria arenilitoris]|uniref:DUF1127 domain-containing protein n=1 Tax=Ruegeria arenilitoris TaxID=1173585 RepID=UPI001481AEE9|nr:DUF1127 domain-containing protein [Ruegeria arenilitoris]